MLTLQCTNCHRNYDDADGLPYRCPTCGGLFDFREFPIYLPDRVLHTQPGIWRYREMFALPAESPIISLGEGNTPLVWSDVDGSRVALKCEFQNPSGSFKDRGSALIASFLKAKGVDQAIEDSSGNAGASFAAYAARAGIQARVYIPDSASGPKKAQIQAYGAELVRILGPRSNAAEAVRRAAEEGSVYASHAYLPFNIPGYATAAYEIVEQLGGYAPGSVWVPVGQGGFILGLLRGFIAMKIAGVIERIPRMIGVQARACAPLWATFAYGTSGLSWVTEGETLAEGIRVRHPLRGDAVLKEMEHNGGIFVSVTEEEIARGRDALAHRGFYVENTSAVVLAAFEQFNEQEREKFADPNQGSAVLVLTGSGLKNLA